MQGHPQDGSPAGDPLRVLLIDDDRKLCRLLRDYLAPMGYDVVAVHDGCAGVEQASQGTWNAVILDVMLPGLDGFEVLRQLRARGDQTPVLILSARAADQDRIRGLELQADDYLTKPFNLRELLLRVDALLRRRPPPSAGEDRLEFGGNRIDFRAMRANCHDGQEIELNATETKLLKLLAGRAGTVVARRTVVEHLFGSAAPTTVRTLDNVMLRLRKLFEHDPAAPKHLHTVRGIGCRFDP